MGQLFTFFALTGLVNAILSLCLALYLTLTSWKVRIARYLVYLCLALGAWSTGYFLWQISWNHDMALFWSRALMVGAIFTSISFLHLVIVFLGLDKKPSYRRLLVLFYIPCFIWEIANFTPYFVADVGPRLFFQFWPLPGPLYILYLLLFSVHVIIASSLLYRKYRTSSGVEKKQTLMLLVGITLTFIGGSSNYFLWYNIPVAPWGNGLASAYAIFSVYAIMRYKFLDVRVVAAEIFTGALLVLAIIDVFLSQNTTEMVVHITAFIIMLFFGIMLVRSVRQELKQKEELAHLAESLEKANLRLQEIDRQKTEFLSIASHQLRTPLSILKGYIELIEDGAYGKASVKLQKVLHDMDESNERLVTLVDEFLDITRIEQGRTKFTFKENDIAAIVTDVVKEFTDRAEKKGLKLSWHPAATPVNVMMDDDKIRHVIFNFVDNAIKYSEKGTIKVFVKEEDQGVALRVLDNGLGFNKEDEANFFQKFYRGKNVEGINVNGTGLGIYVCRQFIESHRGRVWAKSPGLGKGGEFGFWIPEKQPKEKAKVEKAVETTLSGQMGVVPAITA